MRIWLLQDGLKIISVAVVVTLLVGLMPGTANEAAGLYTVRFTARYISGDHVLRNVFYYLDAGPQNLLGTVLDEGDFTFTVDFLRSIRVHVNINPGTRYWEELYVAGNLVAAGNVGDEGLTHIVLGGYIFYVSEGQRCDFNGTKDVAYGASGRFSYKYGVTGSIDCNNSVFGDPAVGIVKACYIKECGDCNYTVQLHPMPVILRGGHITETLRLEIRDEENGKLVSPIGRQVLFASTNPSLVQVDASGVVTSTGFGQAEVLATVQGVSRQARTRVIVGHSQVEPPILLLSTTDEPTGTLNLNVGNADGTPVDLTGRSTGFSGGNSVASVDSTGRVTAHRPPQYFGETPSIYAHVDGVLAPNASVIRVTTDTLGLDLFALEQPNVVFYIPEQIGSFNYRQVFTDYDVARVTDIAYQLVEEELVGLPPFDGGVQFLVNDPGHGADGTVPCGLSGNPIRLGTDVDKPVHNSCLIVAYPPAIPQWGVYFHEMGHNFTGASLCFALFTSGSDVSNSNFSYGEGLASIAGMYAAIKMQERQNELGISQTILDQILPIYHLDATPDLDHYVQNGAHYSQLTPSVVYDIVLKLAQIHGSRIIYRFYSAFLPSNQGYPFPIASDAHQATFFVAAMSAATGQDQRARFRDNWGFPLDEAFYDQIYPQVERMVAQRDPAADAGRDRAVLLGQSVTLDDAYVFDWEGNLLTVTWQIIDRPTGSTASLSDPTVLHPSFLPDKPGWYVLSLTASDSSIVGTVDTVNILAATNLVYLPIVLR